MSEEGSIGASMVEKFFGLILLITGAIAMYYTLTSATVLKIFTGFFGVLSLILIILGLFLIIAKTE
ncbi:MAG: hypothetical protein QHH24_02060 [Candidatus Bathyarchaeota archaeon]|nr:hypothetical protein [Candidatus Bathyarchaeota archaeon]